MIQRFEFNAYRQASLQFGQQVGRFGKMKGAGADEQDMVGFDHAVLGGYGGSFLFRVTSIRGWTRSIAPTSVSMLRKPEGFR